MDEKFFNQLDQIANVAITNLYTISKKDNIIRLSEINYNDDRHWIILNMVAYVCIYMDRTAWLDMSLWQFWKFRRHVKNKRIKRVRNNGGMTCEQFLNDIENANPSIPDPFLTIAKLYYPRKAGS